MRSIYSGLITLALASGCVFAEDQAQWGRQYSRNMVSDEKGLPETFDPASGKNIKWIAEIGNETHAGPVIAGGKVLIGTNNGHPRDPKHQGDRGVLMCLDEKDGRFLWQLIVPKIEGDPYLDWPRGGIVGPPTIEGDRAYVITNRAEVACLNMNGLANGNTGPYKDEARHMTPHGSPLELGPLDADIVWMFDLAEQAGIYHHDAAHCSPLIHGDFIYINSSNGVDNTHRKIRRPDAPSLVVLDKKTGRMVAKDAEHMGPRIFHCTWSSPALGTVNGKPLIFFGGGDGVMYAFEALTEMPAEGKVLDLKCVWKFECDPTAPKENVHKWVGNRKESPSNIMAMPVFDNGRVYAVAGGDIWWGKNQSWLKCIDPTKTGDVTATGEVWSYALGKRSCSTPAIYDGLVFVADHAGNVHCVDAKTGQPCWTHATGAENWGSTLVADGKVYLGNRRGQLWVFAASREKKILSTIDLDSPISSTPAAANGVLFVSTQNRLYAAKAK